jgi:hypothetical protein
MGLKRRAFLRRSGLTLTALGLSEAGLSLWVDRYQQAVAQPTRRKLALLVGINQYPEQVCDCPPVRGAALNGCITDVELQYELLVHRFGFQPADVLVLTDQAATRQGIEEAFLSHLVSQARPDDVVVFHFSGLGSHIKLGETKVDRYSLVPIDGVLPTEENSAINDVLEETLGLLLRSLQTERVTTVLDTSYTDLGRVLQGNLRVRSRPNAPSGRIHEAELALQERLSQQLEGARTQTRTPGRSGLPGVVLAATRANQVATEGQWSGFSAGLFTYALTQQLWWTTPATTLTVSFNQASGAVKQVAGIEQQPALTGQKSYQQIIPADFLSSPISADGVIQAIEEDGKVQLWLAGLPATVLENYGASIFSIAQSSSLAASDAVSDPTSAPRSQASPPLLQIRSREGLLFKARPYSLDDAPTSPPQVGQLVQEQVRLLPRNISLTVALDNSLERIERVDATSAFAAIPKVSVIAGEQPADFLFGKTQSAQTLTASLSPPLLPAVAAQTGDTGVEQLAPGPAPSKSSYGLFYLGRDAIPNTLIQASEAVKTAVHRLSPQLRTLLAMKLLRLTANQGSSRLGIQATLEVVAPHKRLVMQQETARAPWTPPTLQPTSKPAVPSQATSSKPTRAETTALPIGSQIQYRLFNYSDRPVYFILLGLDPSGDAIALYPTLTGSTAPKLAEESLISPGSTITIPQASASGWLIQAPTGLAETYLIFSRAPFTQSYHLLETEMRAKADARQVTLVSNPLEVVQTVLQDLHQGSSAALPKLEVPADMYALDVNTWATLSFVHEVVETEAGV